MEAAAGTRVAADEAKEELAALMDELFVRSLRQDLADIDRRSKMALEELNKKVATQAFTLNGIEQQLRILREKELPTCVQELARADVLEELGQALVQLLTDSERDLQVRLETLQREAGGQLDARTGEIVAQLAGHHTDLIAKAEAALGRSLEQTRGYLAEVQADLAGRVEGSRQALVSQADDAQGRLLAALAQSEKRREQLMWGLVGLGAFLVVMSGVIAFGVFR